MEILSGIIGIGGLVVAALSLYYSYRSRIQPYNDALYRIQIQGASDAIDSLVKVNQAIDKFKLDTKRTILLSADDFGLFKEAVYPSKEILRETILKYSPYFPNRVFLALSEYLAHIELVIGEMKSHEAYASIGRHEMICNPWDHLIYNFALAVQEIRDYLGVGPISSSIAKTFGKNEDLDDDVKAKTRELVRLIQREYDWPISPMLGVDR